MGYTVTFAASGNRSAVYSTCLCILTATWIRVSKLRNQVDERGVSLFESLEPRESLAVSSLLLDFLKSMDLVEEHYHQVFRGILAVNQATGTDYVSGGSRIKCPTETTKRLVSYAVLLLGRKNMAILSSIVNLCSRLAIPTGAKSRFWAARNLADVFGHVVIGPASWTGPWFELLIHTHGFQGHSKLWSVPPTFHAEIKQAAGCCRKGNMTTPRRNRPVKVMGGGMGSRRLFATRLPPASTFRSTMNGKDFELTEEREGFSKRLKVL